MTGSQQIQDLRQIKQALLDGPYLGSVFDAFERIERALAAVPPAEPQEGERRWTMYAPGKIAGWSPIPAEGVEVMPVAEHEAALGSVPKPLPITPDMLDAARRVVDRGMANGDIPETPELHAFSRWAIRFVRDPGPNVTEEQVRRAGEAMEEASIRWLGRDLGTLHRDDIARAALEAALEGER